MNDLEALAILEEVPKKRRTVRPTPRKAQVELWGAQKDYGLQPVAAEVVPSVVLAEIVKVKEINWRAYIVAAIVAAIIILGPYVAAFLYFS